MRNAIAVTAFALFIAAGSASGQCSNLKLVSPTPRPSEHFGQAASMGGGWLFAGTPLDSDGGASAGLVAIWERQNGVWTLREWLTSGAGMLYGRSIANNDSIAAVGNGSGPVLNNFARGGGTIYFRQQNGAPWTSNGAVPGVLQAGDDFGFSAAVGNGRAVFGAPRRDFNAADDMGAVFAYRLNAQNQPVLVTEILHPSANTQAAEHFGYSVAIAPQGGPNAGMLVVGAPDHDNGNITSTGCIYVFNQTGQGYQLQNIPSQWDELFQFNGMAVATNGEWIVSGAPSWGNARGRVMLFQKQANGNWETSGYLSGPEGDGGNFGSSISMSGDWMIVGAPGFDKVYVYHQEGFTWWLRRIVSKDAVSGSTSWGGVTATDGIDFLGGDPGDAVNGLTAAGSVVVKSLDMAVGDDEPFFCDDIPVPGSASGCTIGATPTGGGMPDVCGLSTNAPDVYFKFTAPHSGMVVADTLGSDFDTVLSAHDGEPVWTDSNLVACNDDINGAQNRRSRVSFQTIQGHDYWLRVSGYNGAVGGFTLNTRYYCGADFNDDGFLDFFDFDAFVACFEGIECPEGRTADFNEDGFVDFFDFDAFTEAYARGC